MVKKDKKPSFILASKSKDVRVSVRGGEESMFVEITRIDTAPSTPRNSILKTLLALAVFMWSVYTIAVPCICAGAVWRKSDGDPDRSFWGTLLFGDLCLVNMQLIGTLLFGYLVLGQCLGIKCLLITKGHSGHTQAGRWLGVCHAVQATAVAVGISAVGCGIFFPSKFSQFIPSLIFTGWYGLLGYTTMIMYPHPFMSFMFESMLRHSGLRLGMSSKTRKRFLSSLFMVELLFLTVLILYTGAFQFTIACLMEVTTKSIEGWFLGLGMSGIEVEK
ncbi:hypothetical protein NEDG_01127 [Nematocida displodere]|uniref:Uncharacterized protein n=1 Tax=Nematocida displodere TaxID=1805483 RepID=A0A177EB06_9MICR|nr:hypothetical protein NEDG_01127 [Nematocida displodere]